MVNGSNAESIVKEIVTKEDGRYIIFYSAPYKDKEVDYKGSSSYNYGEGK